MKILFIHPNFPGQYKHLIRHFAANSAHQVVFISKNHQSPVPEGVQNVLYEPTRQPSAATHRYLHGAERAVLQGQEVWRVCRELKQQGFTPDVICVHPGWGDGLFLKDIYPSSPVLSYLEFYYRFYNADVNFDPETPSDIDDSARVRIKNTTNLHNLEMTDWGIAPTHWQKSVHPEEFHHKISVIHEGIDTQLVAPVAEINIPTTKGRVLKKGDPIVTYVTRNFEHYRGSHQFFRAVKQIQEMHPEAFVIAVGADDVSYGRQAADGKHHRLQMLEEVKPDMSRIFFTGPIPYDQFLKVLQISAVHVYLTVPFVLSWSMLEAMSAGCVVLGSATPPVQEVITDGKNGLLVDFFSPEQIAKKVVEVLNHPDKYAPLRQAARQTILDYYDVRQLLPQQIALIEQLAAGQMPPAIHATLPSPPAKVPLFRKAA